MTVQQGFERGFNVQFYKEEPMIILLFQHKELYQETYESIKEEFAGRDLFLEIQVKNNKMRLYIKSTGGETLVSNELGFDKENFEDFTKMVEPEQRISFFTDYATFTDNTIYPLSNWIIQQQNDRIYLTGYKVI